MKILVTGAAGFIGMHVCVELAKEGFDVVGVDNFNSYYSTKLKRDRMEILKAFDNFELFEIDISNEVDLMNVFVKTSPTHVINLAAQAGVRHSITHPLDYGRSNLLGFLNILEACKHFQIEHLIFASSSSVYGNSILEKSNEVSDTSSPLSLYAATKKSNEVMAFSYSHLFGIPITALRLFTVYGPWGRPDMAYFSFTRDILKGAPINVYDGGELKRDFTFIDDLVLSILKLLKMSPSYKSTNTKFRVMNIGNSSPVTVNNLISVIENYTNMNAKRVNLPMQPGDVVQTSADTTELFSVIGYSPSTSIHTGVPKFIDWYIDYNEKIVNRGFERK